ncbi:MAG: DnaJ domain-containing protein [bacterium]|nr:DnaJ domain-containing protein [bacterium]
MAAAPMDPYATLGVARDADERAIKRAYRQLAQQHHPDRNPDNHVAEERFKEISAAYAVLSDPERRKNYDEFGRIALDPNFDAQQARRASQSPFGGFGGQGFSEGATAGGFGNIFDDFFSNSAGGFSRRPAPRKTKGRDREVTLELDLKEASEGCERRVSVYASTAGARERKTLRVQIPRGSRDGARIRLAGKGDPGQHGGPPGDLYCRIKLRPHALFEVDEHDLQLDVPITLEEALLGGEIEIPTLSGRVTLNVPPGTDAGTRLRLRGKGMGRPGDKPAGDLYVTLSIRVPKQLDDEARAHVEALGRLGPTGVRDPLFEDRDE